MTDHGLRIEEIKERDRWDEFFARVPRSPLLQDWSYGDALASTRGRLIERFGIFDTQSRCLAIVQAQKIRLAYRINRGPLWLTDDPEERRVVLNWFGKKFRFLIWAPNEAGGPAPVLAGVKWRLPREGWQSMWLDLRRPEEELSKNLQGKWRNQLNQSNRLAPEAVVSAGTDADWQWFRDEYEKLQTAKTFVGVSLEILEHLRAQPKQSLFLIVKNSGETVAAGLVVRHGQSATYLAGVNTDKGRKIYAHNRMLWFACQHLRQDKIQSFDLGGVDFVNTPGVAHFKVGLGGELYQLPGEFLHAAFF